MFSFKNDNLFVVLYGFSFSLTVMYYKSTNVGTYLLFFFVELGVRGTVQLFNKVLTVHNFHL